LKETFIIIDEIDQAYFQAKYLLTATAGLKVATFNYPAKRLKNALKVIGFTGTFGSTAEARIMGARPDDYHTLRFPNLAKKDRNGEIVLQKYEA